MSIHGGCISFSSDSKKTHISGNEKDKQVKLMDFVMFLCPLGNVCWIHLALGSVVCSQPWPRIHVVGLEPGPPACRPVLSPSSPLSDPSPLGFQTVKAVF